MMDRSRRGVSVAVILIDGSVSHKVEKQFFNKCSVFVCHCVSSRGPV